MELPIVVLPDGGIPHMPQLQTEYLLDSAQSRAFVHENQTLPSTNYIIDVKSIDRLTNYTYHDQMGFEG